jgi:alpha-L-fucosidase 2
MGYIHVLPALSKEWNSGSVRGMRVRGGFELDMSWDEGKLRSLTVYNKSNPEGKCRMRIGSKELEINLQKGKKTDFKLPE